MSALKGIVFACFSETLGAQFSQCWRCGAQRRG
jgi:hypothetical protein